MKSVVSSIFLKNHFSFSAPFDAVLHVVFGFAMPSVTQYPHKAGSDFKLQQLIIQAIPDHFNTITVL